MLSGTGLTNARYGIGRHWGVNGTQTTPSFLSGYANKSYVEADLINIGSGNALSMFFGITANAFPPRFRNNINLKETATGWQTRFLFRRSDTLGIQDVLISTTTTISNLYKTYRLEFYDGGLDVGSYGFDWKVKIDGTVVLESNNGVSQIYSRLSLQPNTLDNAWCNSPVFQFFTDLESSLATIRPTTWDNLAIVINNNTSCLP